jgi:hypothetical protein
MFETSSLVFWFLWACTVGVCLAAIIQSWRSPIDFLGLPLVGCVIWLYFYGYLSYSALTKLSVMVIADQPASTWEVGQLVALLALIGLLLGWYTGRRQVRRLDRGLPVPQYRYGRLWVLGITCLLVGIAAHRLFLAKEVSDREGTSAYWYLLFHLEYPGAALCVFVLTRARAERAWYRVALLALLIGFAMYPHVLNARRGPLYPMIVVLLYTVPLCARARPHRLAILGGLVTTGFVMLFFVTARPYIYHQGTWGDVMQNVSVDQVVTDKASRIEDNEFVYNCLLIATLRETGTYQYGTGYLALLTHWIPRQLWPDKPSQGQGWFPIALDRTEEVTGWSLTGGASAGGVAEVFNQLGWFSVLFWFFLGRVAARISAGALGSSDPKYAISLLGLLCAAHWMISQGFAEAFVPGMIYQLVPLLCFKWSRVRAGIAVPCQTADGQDAMRTAVPSRARQTARVT